MMASSNAISDDKRQKVMVGNLPPDFLRLQTPNMQQQIQSDAATAQMLQQAEQWATCRSGHSNFIGNLNVSITQAKLAKNYGLTKMDPYCRIRMGHMVFETPTSASGAKNPRWNKSFVFKVPQGVESLYIEIYDERTFNQDERIAWAHVTIPSAVFQGDTIDDWYTLNGKQGDEKEGMINLVLSFTDASKLPQPPIIVPHAAAPYVMTYPAVAPVQYPPNGPAPRPPVQAPVAAPPITEADIAAVHELFPSMDKEVVLSVLEAHRGDKEATITVLLQMTEEAAAAPTQPEGQPEQV